MTPLIRRLGGWKRCSLSILVLTAFLPTAGAAEPGAAPPPAPPMLNEDLHLFRSGEVFADLYGIIAGGTDDLDDAVGGGGVGIGYFLTRHIAILGETQVIDAPDQDASLLGGVMLRLPCDELCTAFYGIAEVGGNLGDESGVMWQFGGGFDVRLTDHLSFFSDARGVNTDDDSSLDGAWLFRVGVRFVF